jgi:hypothetical protein
MFRAEIDQGEFMPNKEVKIPYIAVSQMGKLVLVYKSDVNDPDNVWCLVLKGGGDKLPVGEKHRFTEDSLTPLAEGKGVLLTNTWEIL